MVKAQQYYYKTFRQFSNTNRKRTTTTQDYNSLIKGKSVL